MPLWITLFLLFFIMIILRVPISVALGASSLICLCIIHVPLTIIGQRMFTAIDSFGIMAVPFFVLGGNLMAAGGISRKLTELSSALLGFIRGGIAMGGVLACGFFASLSGSSPATVISIGSMLYPDMVKMGYPEDDTAGLFSVAGGLGPLIPPSIIMVVYGTITNTSIGDLFIAGAGIGIISTAALMLTVYIIARKKKWPRQAEKIDFKKLKHAFLDAILAIIMPVIVLGGIYGGIFTPTEAGCVSAVYAFLVGVFVYKNIKMKDIPDIIRRSAIGSATVLFIMATSSVFAWLFAYAGFTKMIVAGVAALHLNTIMFLIVMTIVFLIFGTFMEGIAIMTLLMPIFQPIAATFAVDPIQLGMIVSFSIVLGCITPPVAVNIYAAAMVSKLRVERIIKGQTPYFLVMVGILLLVVLIPQLSTFLIR